MEQEEKIQKLINDGLIDKEDKFLVNKILGDWTIGISLLDLQRIKAKSERKWLKACEEDNLNKMNFLDGFITIINSIINNWGTDGEVYTIM